MSRTILLAAFTATSSVAAAQPGSAIRLKARTFVPPANVHAALPAGREQPGARTQRESGPEPRHYIVQFAGPVTASDLSDLRRAGAVPLRYVPDNAMAVVAGAAFDARGLARVRWSGTLAPSDKISPETAKDLARPSPRFPLTLVEFHPDTPAAGVSAGLAEAGTAAVAGAALPPYMALITTNPTAIERLAALDAVAWMYPAPAEAAAGGAPLCQGLTGPSGIVAEYATVGDGWDGAGAGAADLGVYLLTPTADIDPAVTAREVDRALAEWARHIAVRWQATADPYQAQAITVFWGPTDHGDGYPFAPEVLAHAFYQAPLAPEPIAGDIHFNESFDWGAGDPNVYDIFSVMLHETGHSLGLDHSSDPGAVMYAMYRGIVGGLSPSDIAAARSLYAPAGGTTPAGWSAGPIGGSIAGGSSWADGRLTLDAAGRDVWGEADELRFVYRSLDGDGDIVARVDSLTAVHRWTKAGVMIRAGTAAGAPHAFMLVSGARGLAFQRRLQPEGSSVSTDGVAGTAPRWLWLSRRGSRFEAYAAVDGGGWTLVGADTIGMPQSVLVGLALTSHDPAAVATAVFSNVSVTVPPRWSHADVGAVDVAGSFAQTSTGFRVTGSGADIWGTADAFHFAWVRLDGDGEVVARVASLDYTDRWAKAGVMIRASLDADAPHAFMLASAGKGYAFQRRVASGGISYHTSGGTGAAPHWVKLQRRGTTITALRSADGAMWITVGSATISMGQSVLAGLAVTSHAPGAASLAVFDNVSVR